MNNVIIFIKLFNLIESFRSSILYEHAISRYGKGYYEVSRCEGGWILDYYDDNDNVEHICIVSDDQVEDEVLVSGLYYICDLMNCVIDGEFE